MLNMIGILKNIFQICSDFFLSYYIEFWDSIFIFSLFCYFSFFLFCLFFPSRKSFSLEIYSNYFFVFSSFICCYVFISFCMIWFFVPSPMQKTTKLFWYNLWNICCSEFLSYFFSSVGHTKLLLFFCTIYSTRMLQQKKVNDAEKILILWYFFCVSFSGLIIFLTLFKTGKKLRWREKWRKKSRVNAFLRKLHSWVWIQMSCETYIQ